MRSKIKVISINITLQEICPEVAECGCCEEKTDLLTMRPDPYGGSPTCPECNTKLWQLYRLESTGWRSYRC